MKAKLLKKLRKEASDNYRIVYNGNYYFIEYKAKYDYYWRPIRNNNGCCIKYSDKKDVIKKCDELRLNELRKLFYSKYKKPVY